MNRDLVDVLREVHDRVTDPHHLALARAAAALEVRIGDLPPDLAECRALVGVGHDDEVPVLAVARGRGLLGEPEALLEHLALDRTGEVEALPNRARRGKKLVRSEIETHCGDPTLSPLPRRRIPLLSRGPVAQRIERQPSKLRAVVRFHPGPFGIRSLWDARRVPGASQDSAAYRVGHIFFRE